MDPNQYGTPGPNQAYNLPSPDPLAGQPSPKRSKKLLFIVVGVVFVALLVLGLILSRNKPTSSDNNTASSAKSGKYYITTKDKLYSYNAGDSTVTEVKFGDTKFDPYNFQSSPDGKYLVYTDNGTATDTSHTDSIYLAEAGDSPKFKQIYTDKSDKEDVSQKIFSSDSSTLVYSVYEDKMTDEEKKADGPIPRGTTTFYKYTISDGKTSKLFSKEEVFSITSAYAVEAKEDAIYTRVDSEGGPQAALDIYKLSDGSHVKDHSKDALDLNVFYGEPAVKGNILYTIASQFTDSAQPAIKSFDISTGKIETIYELPKLDAKKYKLADVERSENDSITSVVLSKDRSTLILATLSTREANDSSTIYSLNLSDKKVTKLYDAKSADRFSGFKILAADSAGTFYEYHCISCGTEEYNKVGYTYYYLKTGSSDPVKVANRSTSELFSAVYSR